MGTKFGTLTHSAHSVNVWHCVQLILLYHALDKIVSFKWVHYK